MVATFSFVLDQSLYQQKITCLFFETTIHLTLIEMSQKLLDGFPINSACINCDALIVVLQQSNWHSR